MKKVAFISFVFLTVGFTTLAQETNKNQPERIKLYPTSQQTTNNSNKLTPEQEIAQCEQQIEAIDKKEEWIRQNPEELKIATENGWFIQADENRKALRARIAELKK